MLEGNFDLYDVETPMKDGELTGLLNAGYASAKQVFPSVPVMIHLGQPQKTTVVQTFFDSYKKYGGQGYYSVLILW